MLYKFILQVPSFMCDYNEEGIRTIDEWGEFFRIKGNSHDVVETDNFNDVGDLQVYVNERKSKRLIITMHMCTEDTKNFVSKLIVWDTIRELL